MFNDKYKFDLYKVLNFIICERNIKISIVVSFHVYIAILLCKGRYALSVETPTFYNYIEIILLCLNINVKFMECIQDYWNIICPFTLALAKQSEASNNAT